MKYLVFISLLSTYSTANTSKKVVFDQSSLRDQVSKKNNELRELKRINKFLKSKVTAQNRFISSLEESNSDLNNRLVEMSSHDETMQLPKINKQTSYTIRTKKFFDKNGNVIKEKKVELVDKVSSLIEQEMRHRKVYGLRIVGESSKFGTKSALKPSIEDYQFQQNLNLKKAYKLAAFLISKESGNFKHKEMLRSMIDISESTQMNVDSPSYDHIKIILY